MFGRRRRSKQTLIGRISKWLGLSSPLMLIAMVLSYLGYDAPLQVLRVVEPGPSVVDLIRPESRDDSELDSPSSRRRAETAETRRWSEKAETRRRMDPSSDRYREETPKIVDELFGIGEAFFRPSDKKEKDSRTPEKKDARSTSSRLAGFADEILPPTRRK